MSAELNEKQLNDVVGGEVDTRKDAYENIILGSDGCDDGRCPSDDWRCPADGKC